LIVVFYASWLVEFLGITMTNPPSVESRRPVKFIDQVRLRIRERNLAYATEKTYLHWIRSYIRFHRYRHPADMGCADVDKYLSWLAGQRRVAPKTQAIALNALVFLYRHHLKRELGQLSYRRPRPKRRIPQVLTHTEALAIIDNLQLISRC
jgi:site-specific recombinase XerD